MSTRVVDRVDDWDERPFADGYRSLHEFADEEFSGVVRAGGAELYMTKGAVVGIRHGTIEDFADGTGTAYESPSPALPLLAIMQETNDEVRAEYYSEQTAIAEVDSTLADGGFTGYVELSENVLSGDYYLVYHGGRSMSVGFVGSSSRLIDGDEAFDTANDEVGIYQVRPADIEVVEIPEAESTASDVSDSDEASSDEGDTADEERETTVDDESADANDDSAGTGDEATDAGDESAGAEDEQTGAGDESAGTDDDPAATGDSPTDADGSEPATEQASPDEEVAASEDGATAGEAVASTAGTRETPGDTASTERSGASRQRETPAESEKQSTDADGAATEQAAAAKQRNERSRESSRASSSHESGGQSSGTVNRDNQHEQRQPGGGTRTGNRSQGARSTQERRESAESPETPAPELGLETRAIPSLDPERTSDPDENGGSARADTFERSQERQPPAPQPGASTAEQSGQQHATRSEPIQTTTQDEGAADSASESETGVDGDRIEELQSEITERDEEIDRLEAELDRKSTEYEDAKSQLEAVREERDELETEVERLEAELDNLETQFGAATDAERRMTPAEALAGTDIFPRYESKGDATLKKAHGGSHRREDVIGNLRLEKNTQFDSDAVSVGGQTYDEFLESTMEYRFVNWVVSNLLFEIRETGHEKALKDLYDALPTIDWADLKGTVEVVYSEDGQETRSQESFDIVLRNRMGEPLVVANVNDSREGATESMMESLVRSAERVGQTTDAFAGAFLVTKSFFEPPALETADDATKGGLLNRNKRKSFVNLSRKQGYHLCLVEARNENFTLLVPEL